jgi:uncharacterized protein (TIGR03435 family)
MTRLMTITALLLVGTVDTAAQSPSPVTSALAFEVASIRRNVSADQGASVRTQPGGALTITNNTLFNIIRNAYNVQGFQIIIEGPDWINRDRWNIVAKAEGNPQGPQMMGMLQSLVADRFKADIRRETRELQVYALTLARSDGRLGPQLTPSTVDCAALAAARTAGAPPPPPRTDGRPTCGMNINPGVATAGGYLIADIARNLSGATGRIIVDKTGLTGRYDMELKWTPDPTQGSPSTTFDGGSLFTAVQEQLGLKLEAQRAPVEVLVVYSAERPVED